MKRETILELVAMGDELVSHMMHKDFCDIGVIGGVCTCGLGGAWSQWAKAKHSLLNEMEADESKECIRGMD